MYLGRLERPSLDIPGFLRRRSAHRAPENAHPPEPESAEKMLVLSEGLGGNCRRSEANSSCPTTSSMDDGGD
jgi:hypothetical protein